MTNPQSPSDSPNEVSTSADASSTHISNAANMISQDFSSAAQDQRNASTVASRETNVMAIIGLVLSLTCLGFGIGSLVVSIIGLNQINKQPERYQGKSLAIWGIVLSAIQIVILLFIGLLIAIGLFAAVKSGNLNQSSDTGTY